MARGSVSQSTGQAARHCSIVRSADSPCCCCCWCWRKVAAHWSTSSRPSRLVPSTPRTTAPITSGPLRWPAGTRYVGSGYVAAVGRSLRQAGGSSWCQRRHPQTVHHLAAPSVRRRRRPECHRRRAGVTDDERWRRARGDVQPAAHVDVFDGGTRQNRGTSVTGRHAVTQRVCSLGVQLP